MKYGLPYKGSKNKIAEWVVSILPHGGTLCDLFCGGCAVTHAAMVSGKYDRFIINDIDPVLPGAFVKAISGEFADERRVIDRETFDRLKDADPYVALCWSFGSNAKAYLWNAETAGAKLLACKMIMADTWQERRRYYREFIFYLQQKREELEERKARQADYIREHGETEDYLRNELRNALKTSGRTAADVDRHLGTKGMAGHYFGKSQWAFPTRAAYEKMREILPLPEYDYYSQGLKSLERLKNLQKVESLERIQDLDSLQRLERFQKLQGVEPIPEVRTGDYRDIALPDDAVIYCDIPYHGTDEYKSAFDHEAFYDWAESRKQPVFISEYVMPQDRFRCIAERRKTSSFSGSSNSTKTIEKIFIPIHQPYSPPASGLF